MIELKYVNFLGYESSFDIILEECEKDLGDALINVPELAGRISITYVNRTNVPRNFDGLQLGWGRVINYGSLHVTLVTTVPSYYHNSLKTGHLRLRYIKTDGDVKLYEIFEYTWENGGRGGLVWANC